MTLILNKILFLKFILNSINDEQNVKLNIETKTMLWFKKYFGKKYMLFILMNQMNLNCVFNFNFLP